MVLSSTYHSLGRPGPDELVYARTDTETWHPFEEALAALEGTAVPALVMASGQAAADAALALLPPGGRLVLPRHAYHGVLACARDVAEHTGAELVEVDVADTAAVAAAVRGAPGRPAAMLWVESPTNPMLEVADLPALVAAAHEVGALVVVDNTFATPLVQRPLLAGADVVVHSATKYLAGHSDVVLGALVVTDPGLRDRLHRSRTLHGAVPGPVETWLALRGLRTLALRVERAQATAAELAARLVAHPSVVEVRHPSLPGDPGHDRAAAQLAGYGSVLAVRPAGGPAAADAVVEAVRLWLPATSLGGVESSLERRRRFDDEAPSVPEDLLRLSVGIEDVEDLWTDLDRALRVATGR